MTKQRTVIPVNRHNRKRDKVSAASRVQQLFSQRVVASDNVLVRELSEEAVLLNLDSGIYFGLDQTGFRVWTVLTAADSISAAYEQLLSEYEVDPEQLLESLDELLSQCMGQGLLKIVP